MAQQIPSIGTNPNDGTGESLRSQTSMFNSNFTELYALQSDTINAGAVAYNFSGATNEQRIALADADAVLLGKSRVRVPASMIPYDITLCPASTGVQRVREGGNDSVYEPEAYGAAGDNVRNDYANIQACINAAAGIGTVVLNRLFLSSTQILIPSNSEIVGLGWFAGWRFDWLLATGGGGATYVQNSDTTNGNTSIRLRDFTVKGAWGGGPAGAVTTYASGILFRRGSAIQIRGMQVQDIPYIGVAHQGISDFKASGNYIHDTGRDGLTGGPFSTSPSDDVSIVDNTLVDIHDDMIACNMSVDTSLPGTTPPRRWTIVGNVLRGGASLSADNFARGIMVHGGEDILIGNNQVHDTSWSTLHIVQDPITAQRNTRIVVVGNKFRRAGQVGTNLGGNGVTIQSVDGLTLNDNEISDPKNYAGNIQDVNGFEVNNNACSGAGANFTSVGFGLWFQGTSAVSRDVKNGQCKGNRVTTSYSAGIYLKHVDHVDVIANECYNNGQAAAVDSLNSGIAVEGAGTIRLHHNICYDDQAVKKQRVGISLRGSAIDDASIVDNDLRGNNGFDLFYGITPTVNYARGNRFSAGAQTGRTAMVNGTVTVSTVEIRTGDNVSLTWVAGAGTTRGVLTVGTIVNATSFVIRAEDLAGALSADDDSTVFWEIAH